MRAIWMRRPALLTAKDVRACVGAALALGGRTGLAVDVVFVGDEFLRELHERFLDDPTPTDVITFDLEDDAAPVDSGPASEIYVSVDCARRVARHRGAPVAREIALYVVHGALHLCGFDDHAPADRKRMRAAEARVLRALGWRTR